MYKKIDIYLNGGSLCSTNQAKTCKEAIQKIRDQKQVIVASIPSFKTVIINDDDKLTAFYSKY